MSHVKNNDNDITTVRLSKKIKKRLDEMGNVSDTYETVIVKLLDYYDKNKNRKGDK